MIAASEICLGVLKSGWPMPKLIISFPLALSSSAFAKITKALSVPNFVSTGLIVFPFNFIIVYISINNIF